MASSLSDYIFSIDFNEISPSQQQNLASLPGDGVIATSAMWGIESFPFENGNAGISPPETDTVTGVLGSSSYPERLGISDIDVAQPILPEFDMGLCDIVGIESLRGGFRPDVYDCCEKQNGFASDFRPLYTSSSPDVWGIQSYSLPRTGEPSSKVGRYSVEERKDRILKYLKKRNQRNFNKTIKYACRKTLADRRVRVRGRFARNNDHCEEAMPMKNDSNLHEGEEYLDYEALIKHNEEEWLKEAVPSLYFPIFAGYN